MGKDDKKKQEKAIKKDEEDDEKDDAPPAKEEDDKEKVDKDEEMEDAVKEEDKEEDAEDEDKKESHKKKKGSKAKKDTKKKSGKKKAVKKEEEAEEEESEEKKEDEKEDEMKDGDDEEEGDKEEEDKEDHSKKSKKRSAPAPSGREKRARKSASTVAYKPEDFSQVDNTPKLVKGKGSPIGDLEESKEKIESYKDNSDDLAAAYRFIFAPRGRLNTKEIKGMLLAFNGYIPEPADGAEKSEIEKTEKAVEVGSSYNLLDSLGLDGTVVCCTADAVVPLPHTRSIFDSTEKVCHEGLQVARTRAEKALRCVRVGPDQTNRQGRTRGPPSRLSCRT